MLTTIAAVVICMALVGAAPIPDHGNPDKVLELPEHSSNCDPCGDEHVEVSHTNTYRIPNSFVDRLVSSGLAAGSGTGGGVAGSVSFGPLKISSAFFDTIENAIRGSGGASSSVAITPSKLQISYVVNELKEYVKNMVRGEVEGYFDKHLDSWRAENRNNIERYVKNWSTEYSAKARAESHSYTDSAKVELLHETKELISSQSESLSKSILSQTQEDITSSSQVVTQHLKSWASKKIRTSSESLSTSLAAAYKAEIANSFNKMEESVLSERRQETSLYQRLQESITSAYREEISRSIKSAFEEYRQEEECED